MKWSRAIWTVIVFASGVVAGKWMWRDTAGTAVQLWQGTGQPSVSDVKDSGGAAAARLGKARTAADWMRLIAQQPGGAAAAEFLAYIQTLDADGLQALAEDIWRLPEDAAASDEAVGQLLARWAALDPKHMMAAALKWKDSGPDGGKNMGFPLTLIKALEGSSPATLVGALGAVHDTPLMYPVWRGLWYSSNREELMRHFIASPHPEALNFLMGAFEADFDTAKPAEAEAVLRMLVKYQPSKVASYTDAIIAWASKDQAAALAFAQTLTDEHQRARAMTACLEGLARSDPQAALARAQEVPAGQRRDFMRAAFNKWCSEDRSASLTWAQANLSGNDLLDALGAIARGPLQGRTPEEDAALLSGLTHEDRNNALRSIASRWYGKESPDSATGLRWLASLPPEDVTYLLENSNQDRIGQLDPALLSELLLKSPQALANGGALHGQISAFMKSNQPQEALAWAARIPGTAMQGEAMRHLFSEWQEKDPAAADTAALALTDPALRGPALRALAERKAGADPTAAWAWAQQLTGAGRDEAVATVLWHQMGRLTPQESAAELAAFRNSGNSADLSVLNKGFAEKWARTDPHAAASWAAQLPPDEQPAAYAGLAETWADRDPAAASEWLTQLPRGTQRDAAIASFASEIRSDDPSTAITWAAAISDPIERFATIQALFPTDSDQRNLRLLLMENPALTAEDRARLGR